LNGDPSENDTAYSQQQIDSACEGPLHPEARRGLRLFNAGEYFEAHEALENAWRDEPGPIRDLYRGILQVGVAYYHISRGNYSGARKMFQRCRQWLDPFPSNCRGIDIDRLRRDYLAVEQRVIRAGPHKLSQIDQSYFKPISYSDNITEDGP
jgi:uncharacterized protein